MAHGLGMARSRAGRGGEGAGIIMLDRDRLLPGGATITSIEVDEHQCGPDLAGAARAAGDGGRDLGPGRPDFTFRELLERLLAVLGRRRLLLPLPFALAEALAASLERLPNPPLTHEEVRLLRTDKVTGGLPTPAALGIAARPLGKGLPVSLQGG
jgi:uncharacterized protein YbjT (DUF2867 family)